MVLVDTSIWINHFRRLDSGLADLLAKGVVACHPFIIGELACVNLKNREEILSLFQSLPSTTVVEQNEFMEFVESRKLSGNGLGFVDVHILASAVLAGVALWTGDKSLDKAARDIGVSYKR